MPAQDPDFGPLLRRLRIAAGFSSAQRLAGALTTAGHPISGTSVNNWEAGKAKPRGIEIVWKVEEMLGGHGRLIRALYPVPDDVSAEQIDRTTEATRDYQMLLAAEAGGRDLTPSQRKLRTFLDDLSDWPLDRVRTHADLLITDPEGREWVIVVELKNVRRSEESPDSADQP